MVNSRIPRLLLTSALPLAMLAACGDDVAEEEVAVIADDGREASGEILPSSISDDMIATDRLRSQPPLLQDDPAARSGSAANGAAADSSAGVNDAAAVSDAPQAEPTPEPSVEDIGLPDD